MTRSTTHPQVHRGTSSRTLNVAGVTRVLAAVCVTAVAAVHLHLYEDGFSAVPTIGRLFLANVVTGACIAVMLLVDRRRWMWAALAAAYCIATLGSFLWSVQFGLFGYQETLRGTWQERAAVVEIAGAVLSAAAAILAARAQRARSGPREAA
jgi:hypothetical protein